MKFSLESGRKKKLEKGDNISDLEMVTKRINGKLNNINSMLNDPKSIPDDMEYYLSMDIDEGLSEEVLKEIASLKSGYSAKEEHDSKISDGIVEDIKPNSNNINSISSSKTDSENLIDAISNLFIGDEFPEEELANKCEYNMLDVIRGAKDKCSARDQKDAIEKIVKEMEHELTANKDIEH